MLRFEFGERRFGIGDDGGLAIAAARSREPLAKFLRNEAGHESRHDEAAIVLEAAQHVVGRVARMIA